MDENKYTKLVQWAVTIASAILLLSFIGAWIHEGASKEWRKVQREYGSLLEDGEDFERGILQVELPQFNRVDRCISCHPGIEDPRMDDAPQPHTAHPGSFMADHPVKEYGCTICHGGQGRALSREDAFGRLRSAHWASSLLEPPYIQASCGKCHLAIFDTGESETEVAMEGMDVFIKGKHLFSQEGCLGCHKARGVGGILGPDLTRQGEKTKHEYSFQNISGEQSVSHWLKEHFKDPEMVSPGSQMLQIHLEEEELEALATFVMGLSKPDIPFDYFTIPTLNEFKGIRDTLDGATAFAYLCSACHGKKGEGKDYKEYDTGIPSVGRSDFLRVASEDFIRFTMEKGRSLRQMGSWTGSISGMGMGELDGMAVFIKNRGMDPEFSGSLISGGNVTEGSRLFDQKCKACHGENGSGDVAVALDQHGFLSRADNDFIVETMLRGRGNTAMPGWSHLEREELGSLLAVIRSWSTARPQGGEMILPEPNLEEGALRYHFLCHRCHGEFGEGETGPSIINADFLEAAGNNFLYGTIAEGRENTAMFGWSSDVYDQERLGLQDISNIIGFMRKSAREPLTYIFPGSNPGDRARGAEVFARRCAECHGASGEGTKAPALNNQEFLSAASNGFLMATMTIGRKGTAMPSWGYGSGEFPVLSGEDRKDVVAHIRSWQRIRIKY
ncbi:MAG: c-type cytochrome [Bacteroidetes bacterium]|nr:c-type cytochrome [Bacteroidota bacterium]